MQAAGNSWPQDAGSRHERSPGCPSSITNQLQTEVWSRVSCGNSWVVHLERAFLEEMCCNWKHFLLCEPALGALGLLWTSIELQVAAYCHSHKKHRTSLVFSSQQQVKMFGEFLSKQERNQVLTPKCFQHLTLRWGVQRWLMGDRKAGKGYWKMGRQWGKWCRLAAPALWKVEGGEWQVWIQPEQCSDFDSHTNMKDPFLMRWRDAAQGRGLGFDAQSKKKKKKNERGHFLLYQVQNISSSCLLQTYYLQTLLPSFMWLQNLLGKLYAQGTLAHLLDLMSRDPDRSQIIKNFGKYRLHLLQRCLGGRPFRCPGKELSWFWDVMFFLNQISNLDAEVPGWGIEYSLYLRVLICCG